MMRMLSIALSILILLAGASWTIIYYFKQSHRLLPINTTMEQPESNYLEWEEFTNSEADFRVLFPTLVQHFSEKAEDSKGKIPRQNDTYLAQNKDGTIYMINQFTYLDAIDSIEVEDSLLSELMNDMLSAKPENELKLMKKGSFQGHTALDFSMDNDQFNYEVKAFIVGKHLFVLSSVTGINKENEKDFNFFVNSFQLMNKEDPLLKEGDF